MEDLTKQQIVLVTILTSFVTSIATGIVVVSLVDTTPQGNVVQTINRVVERTIEKVVTPEPAQQQAAAIQTVKTVIVPAEDVIAQATEKTINSVGTVKLVQRNSPASFVAIGAVVGDGNVLMTDAGVINESSKYTVTLYGHTEAIPVTEIVIPKNSAVAFLKFGPVPPAIKLNPLEIAENDQVKVGQTNLVYNGREVVKVAQTLVDGQLASTPTTPDGMSFSQTMQFVPGSFSVNLQGKISGMYLVDTATARPDFPFVSVTTLKSSRALLK